MKSSILALATTLALSTQAFGASGTTSTTTEEAKKKEPAIKLNFYSEIYGGAANVNRNERDSVSSYNYMGFTTKLSKTENFQLRAVFETGQASVEGIANIDKSFQGKAQINPSEVETEKKTLNNTQEFSMGDWILRYTNSKTSFLGDDIRTQVRVYLPTSESSDALGKYSLRMYATVPLGELAAMKWSASFVPNVHFYTKRPEGQNGLDGLMTLDGTYSFNDDYSLTASVYYRPLWYNTGQRFRLGGLDVNGNRQDPTFSSQQGLVELGYAYLYFSAAVTENLNIDLYAEHRRDLSATNPFILFNEDETSYGLVLSASL